MIFEDKKNQVEDMKFVDSPESNFTQIFCWIRNMYVEYSRWGPVRPPSSSVPGARVGHFQCDRPLLDTYRVTASTAAGDASLTSLVFCQIKILLVNKINCEHKIQFLRVYLF